MVYIKELNIVDNPNRVRLQFRSHALAQTFPQRHPIPRALSHELLQSLYISFVRAIGKRLDGLAFSIQQKSTNVNSTPMPSLAPAQRLEQILQELFQAFSAFLDLGIRHARDGSTAKTKGQALNVVILVGLPRHRRRNFNFLDLRQSGLRVITLARARDQRGICHSDFQVVIFVSLRFCRRRKRYLVISTCIRHAFLQQFGNIIVYAERKSAALYGEHLQPQVAQIHLIRITDAFHEGTVVESARAEVAAS